jgi:hypothetical protein
MVPSCFRLLQYVWECVFQPKADRAVEEAWALDTRAPIHHYIINQSEQNIMKTLSYHSDPSVKARHVEMAKAHLKMDMLRAGTYGEGNGKSFKACSVGCFAHDINKKRDDKHAVVAEDAGWPEWLVRLNDTLFEGLPEDERNDFHVALREAVPVGVDLEPVRHKLAIRRLMRVRAIVEALPSADYISAVIAAINGVLRLHEAESGGNVCTLDDWSAARSAAWAAARSAESAESAESAARSAAWAAAWAAWEAARSAESAESAAWAESVARWALSARAAEAYQQERDDLLSILRSMDQSIVEV